MALYLTHRPTTLDSVKGNEELLTSLQSMLSKPETCPHSFLLHGPTGCGKTTIARIIATSLGCVGNDYREIDSADFRGIDTVREISKQSMYKSLEGNVRVFVIDECFSRGTQIRTPEGLKSIEDMKPGDNIYSLFGKDKVLNIFTNKVSLERIMLLKFNNGTALYCSKDHLFFTTIGWVKACLLTNEHIILSFNNLQNYDQDNKILQDVQNKTEEKSKVLLFLQMLQSIKWTIKACQNRMERMSSLQNAFTFLFGLEERKQLQILQQQMCGDFQFNKQFRIENERIFKTSNFNFQESISSDRKRKTGYSEYLEKNDAEQSLVQSDMFCKNTRNKTFKWNTSYLAWKTWWKWILYTTTNITFRSTKVENGSCSKNRKFTNRWFRIPFKLQSGYREQKIENSNRSGWKFTQCEKDYIARSEERTKTENIRLESSTFYKQGSTDKYFSSLIEDKERNDGFVNFYDLEVEKHPSYFANNLAVHNCHKMTNDAQNAFLKRLEDTPKHVYFILCTTEPNKLIAAIRGRCSQFQVKPLNDKWMLRLLKQVVRNEGETLEMEIYEQIIQDSMGHSRNALQILEQVLNVPADKRLKAAQQTAEQQSQSIELCRALIRHAGWKEISKILSDLRDQDPEGIRRQVLGYAQAVLLKKDEPRAGFILEEMIEPFYNSGFPQLVCVCYILTKN